MIDGTLAHDPRAAALTADQSVRDWLRDPQGSAALAAALAEAGISLDTLRPLSGFTLRTVAAMVGQSLSPVEDFVERAHACVVSDDWGASDHWATTALGRQPLRTISV